MRHDLRSLVCGSAVAAVVVAFTLLQRPAEAWIWGVAELALLWVAGVALLLLRRTDAGRLDAVTLLAFAGLTAWTGLSLLWSLDPGEAAVTAQQRLVSFAVIGALLVAGRRRDADAVLEGVLGGCVVVCVAALSKSVVEGLPLSWPIGYSNALGLLAGIGVLLALGLTMLRGSSRAMRRFQAASVPPTALTLVLAGSIGAIAATLVGLTVLAALLPRGRAVLAGLVAVAVATLVIAVVIGGLAGDSSRSALGVRESVDSRLALWRVAVQSVPRSPVVGEGAGSFQRLWLQNRHTRAAAYSAHDVYLETAAELGMVGLGLMAVALAAPFAVLGRGVASGATAGLPAYAAFVVHAAIDVDWHIPVIAVTGLLCGVATVLAARPPDTARAVRPPIRMAALAIVAALGGFAYAGFMSAAAISRSRQALARWNLDAAVVDARSAATWAPWSGEPWRLLGGMALASGDLGRARASFRRGVSIDPADAALWHGLARTTSGRAHRLAAARAAALDPSQADAVDRTARSDASE